MSKKPKLPEWPIPTCDLCGEDVYEWDDYEAIKTKGQKTRYIHTDCYRKEVQQSHEQAGERNRGQAGQDD